MSSPVEGGHPDSVPRGGRALAVWGGAWGAVVSGDVEEGVEEEVSDAFSQGGCLDQGDRQDALGWCRRCGGAAPPGPRVPGGAAVPMRGCVGRRVRPVQRLMVRGVMAGVVWVGEGGRRCRVWGPVMGFTVAVAGRGDTRWRVSAGGSTSIGWCWLLCCVRGLVSGGGAGGVVWGWHCWWWAGAGVGVVPAGGLGALVHRVGVVCVPRAVLAVPGWLWCRGVGGWRPRGRPAGAVVRMLWVAAGGWCSLVWDVGGGAAAGGGALLLIPDVACVRARLPAGPWGCTVARVSWARVVGAADGAGPRGGGVEGVLVVCGTPALVGVVVEAGGCGICDGVVW